MKRKIQHDAINNQEDEDSSTYPILFINDDTPDNKEKESAENSAIHSSIEEFNNKAETTK